MVVPWKGRSGVAELPCRLADPELFFAEAPTDVEEAKALCLDCPVREALPGRCARSARAVGSLGRRALRRRRRRGAQAAARTSRKYPVAEPFVPAARREGNEAAA